MLAMGVDVMFTYRNRDGSYRNVLDPPTKYDVRKLTK